jgi:hypothetical protein
MNLSIVLTCEYIWQGRECISYLSAININPKLYEYVYDVLSEDFIHKKKVRKLEINYVSKITNINDLSGYTNLIMIVFSTKINEKLHTYPQTVTHLVFTNDFIGTVYCWPQNLIYLRWCCNQKFPKLPKTLIHLNYDSYDTIDLPESLIYLNVGYHFNDKITFPRSLKFLKWQPTIKLPEFTIGSDNIIHLEIKSCSDINIMPSKLKYLSIHNISDCTFPDTLTHLILHDVNLYNIKFPSSITNLEVHNDSYKGVELSEHIKKLKEYWELTKQIDRMIPELKLPKSLKYLKWDWINDLPLLPHGLRYLILGGCYNRPIDILPNLIHLECGHNFDQELNKLSSELRYLKLGVMFGHKIQNLPEQIRTIDVMRYYPHLYELFKLYDTTVIKVYDVDPKKYCCVS